MTETRNLEHKYESSFELAEQLDELLIQVSVARQDPAVRPAYDVDAARPDRAHLADVLRELAAALATAAPIALGVLGCSSLSPSLMDRLERDDELRTTLTVQLPVAADRLLDGSVEDLGSETVDALSHLASIAETEASSAHWRATRF